MCLNLRHGIIVMNRLIGRFLQEDLLFIQAGKKTLSGSGKMSFFFVPLIFPNSFAFGIDIASLSLLPHPPLFSLPLFSPLAVKQGGSISFALPEGK